VFLVFPEDLDVQKYTEIFPALILKPFSRHHFENIKTFNRFKIQPYLYESFAEYEFLLFYELDSFVFKDDLNKWCKKNYDYIGAPWFEGFFDSNEDSEFIGVGNGGFSLRKTASAIKVSRSFQFIDPNYKVFDFKLGKWGPRSLLLLLLKRFRYRFFGNRFHYLFNRFLENDDVYWGIYASKRFKWWKHPDYATARSFAFESHSPKLFQELGHLPFGCHKWNVIHREFWKPIIESYGYQFPKEEEDELTVSENKSEYLGNN
jgi:hypothetical protein